MPLLNAQQSTSRPLSPIDSCPAENHLIGGCALDVGQSEKGQRVLESSLTALPTPDALVRLDTKEECESFDMVEDVLSPLAHNCLAGGWRRRLRCSCKLEYV